MKYLYIALGSFCVAAGIIGAFLPLLPTTPFLLLASALYLRSSPRLHSWLLNHRVLGTYLRCFLEYKAIPLRAKIISVALLWTTMLYCIFFIVPHWWLQIILGFTAIGVTLYILSFKTLRKDDLNQKG